MSDRTEAPAGEASLVERARRLRGPTSLALRLSLAAGLWIALALVVAGLVLSTLFRAYVERSFDARLGVLLESLIAVADLDRDGQMNVQQPLGEPRFDQIYSGWYWQVAGPSMTPLRSRSLWDQGLPIGPEPAPGEVEWFPATGPNGERLLVAARDITFPGSRDRYRFAVAGSLGDIEGEVRRFDTALAWSLGALGIGLVVALLLQVRFGLQPLRRLSAGLVAIRTGRAARLGGEFPREIEPLARELNNLLEHNAVVVERARTHVSNLAHALKTPLAVLVNEAAGESGPLADTVRRQAAAMRAQVEHYLSRARTAATAGVLGARTELAPVLEDLRRTLLRIHADRGIAIECRCEPGLAFRGERQDLEEMLGNLLDNACKWGRSRVQVTASPAGDRLEVVIEDDGPGLSAAERAALFQRGKRLDEAVPGSGHGLAIVRDIADLYGGAVALQEAALGGVAARLVLPRAEALPGA
jgi:signal transduction histidine kinase